MTIDRVIHQVLSGRILGLKAGGMNCRQIAAYLNGEGCPRGPGRGSTLSCCLGDQEGSDERSVDS